MRVLEELGFLIEAGNNRDFSDLVENYLSVYYDDIDALFLLAEFNQVNGSYLEVVNVFLLARRESVKLLIDTGASMTAVSRESFETLNANGDNGVFVNLL